MSSGGIRFDFTSEDNFTQGEFRTIRFPVKDAVGALLTDFTGWKFAWYLFNQLKDNATNPSAGALVTKTSEAGGITDPATAPNVDVLLLAADTTGRLAKTYWYELWRTDGSNDIRLAYGQFPIIS